MFNIPNEFASEGKQVCCIGVKLCKQKGTMRTKENARFLHTQEVRGSSPCAPTILFKDLRGAVSSNSGLLLFEQVVAEVLRQ